MYGETEGGVGRRPLINDDRMLVVASGGGEYEKAALDGTLFYVASQTNVTTTAALATTWTGLGVGNPATSGKDYVFYEFSWGQEIVMNTEGVVGLMIATVGDMAQAVTPRAAKWGSATTNALTDDGATIGTPIFVKPCGSTMEGAISTVPSLGPNVIPLKGGIVIPPGYALLSYTFAIQTTSIQFGYVWKEVDV